MTMRFDRFLKAAGARPPAMVLQVSWANGLDIIRDLAANDVPLLAADANPRALGLYRSLGWTALGEIESNCPQGSWRLVRRRWG